MIRGKPDDMICPVCDHQNREGHHFCTQCGARLDAFRGRRGRLIVISEPNLSSAQRRRNVDPETAPERRMGVEITQQSFLIGRNDDNTFILNDDQASAHHAKITYDGRQFWLEDIGSTNGTYIDGVRIHAPVLLRTDYLIKFGTTIVKFEYIPLDKVE